MARLRSLELSLGRGCSWWKPQLLVKGESRATYGWGKVDLGWSLKTRRSGPYALPLVSNSLRQKSDLALERLAQSVDILTLEGGCLS